jgi:hypothetical protein
MRAPVSVSAILSVPIAVLAVPVAIAIAIAIPVPGDPAMDLHGEIFQLLSPDADHHFFLFRR